MTLPRLRAFTDLLEKKLENRTGKPRRPDYTPRATTPQEVLSIATSTFVNPNDDRSGWGELFNVVRRPKVRAA